MMQLIPQLIHAETIIDAWKKCATSLIKDGNRFNLVVHIDNPSLIDNDQLRQFDPKRVDTSAMSVFDVANTIFPKHTAKWNLDVEQFSDYYKTRYARLKHKSNGWGFYFQRLVSFGKSDSNQLSGIVNRLSTWGRRHHGAFGLHLSSAETDSPLEQLEGELAGAFGLHLSSVETDKPRPRGAPCWQYAQFMANDGRLELLVAYRSHDYFLKALGNFVGLARLLTFVCRKTGHKVGSMTCVSTYAHLKNKTKVRQLLDR